MIIIPRNKNVNRRERSMERMCRIIKIRPEIIPEYKRIHAEVWPEILKAIAKSNVKNYSIFLREPENLLISYWEYHGTNYVQDMEDIKRAPRMQEWWNLTDPMQVPLETRASGEWWAAAPEVFHTD
jgi:L-rhamnose mutarotase